MSIRCTVSQSRQEAMYWAALKHHASVLIKTNASSIKGMRRAVLMMAMWLGTRSSLAKHSTCKTALTTHSDVRRKRRICFTLRRQTGYWEWQGKVLDRTSSRRFTRLCMMQVLLNSEFSVFVLERMAGMSSLEAMIVKVTSTLLYSGHRWYHGHSTRSD